MTAFEMQYEFEKRIGQFENPNFVRPFMSHEIEELLTRSMFDVIEEIYSGRVGDNREKVDADEMIKKYMSSILSNQTILVAAMGTGFHANAKIATLNTDVLYVLEERANISYTDDNGDTQTKEINVMPITFDEYNIDIHNPYLKPYEDLIWRMDYSVTGTTKRIELITDGVISIVSYKLTYIKKPADISIRNGVNCSLDEMLHDRVVDGAVKYALMQIPKQEVVEQNK